MAISKEFAGLKYFPNLGKPLEEFVVLSVSFMRKYLFLPSLILCGVLLYSPSSGNKDGAQAEPQQNHLEEVPATIPESKNQVIKLTDKGVEPANLTMKKEDSIAFFLNDSKESLATMEIDFHGLTTHCASANLKIGDDSVIRSTKPIGPKDFASVCFHNAGKYDFTIFGLAQNPKGIKGSIIVE